MDLPPDFKPAAYAKQPRRRFLINAGVIGLFGGVVLNSCSKNASSISPTGYGYDAGPGDAGVYNYLYAIEQVQAAYFALVVASPYPNISDDELNYMKDIHNHDFIHQSFFKKVLGTNSYPVLATDFSAINFTDRTTVLATAKTLKNLSVAAYNGIAYQVKFVDYLVALSKIASVEGRHASAIGNLIKYGQLLDDTSVNLSTSQEIAKTPVDVLPLINSYLKTKITANSL